MEQTSIIAPPSPENATGLRPAWRFEVIGHPEPQGSMVPFIGKYDHRAHVKPSNETALKRWRREVERQAREQLPDWLLGPEGEPMPLDGPVFVSLIVTRKRSPKHYLADGVTLRKGARRYPDTAPDSDKLERAIFDALTGVAFVNDGRIVTNITLKRYCGLDDQPGVGIEIVSL